VLGLTSVLLALVFAIVAVTKGTRRVIRAALAGAAVVLAGLAVRAAAFATTRRRPHSGAVRSVEVVLGVAEALGAAGCVIAARSRRAPHRRAGVGATVVR
jgi:hypothetical protein